MCELLININPLLYILIVNIFALIWAVRSWKKNIREKWMNNLRDAGADLIGAAELLHADAFDNGVNLQAQTKSSFIAKEQKLLLLFAHDESEKKSFEDMSEALRAAAESQDSGKYRSELRQFSQAINDRVLKEWQSIK